MHLNIKQIEEAHNILKEYNGDNPYIISIKNKVYIHKISKLNDFEAEFILLNHNNPIKKVGKLVMISKWFGEKLKNDYNIEFTPEKIVITWHLGSTSAHHVFYCKYRRSQEKPILVTAPKDAILTDFLSDDFHNLNVDFSKYNGIDGTTLYPQQEEGIKFLLSKKRAILSLDMGLGKTKTSIIAALEGGYKHILVVAPASVKETWKKELAPYVNEDDITIVQGSKWKDAKFTIINYDILDNFYTIPTQKVKKKELNVDSDGNVITEIKEKEIVSKSKKIINEAMMDSQLFQAKYDLIILDEAHRLSNSTSGRFKIISDLVKRSNPKGIFEVTGTIITNSSKNLYNLLKILDVPVTRNWQRYMERYCGAQFFYKKNERNAYTAMFLKQKGKSTWYDLSYDEKKELDSILERKCKKICVPGEDTNMEELQEIIKPYYLRRTKEELKMVPKKIKCLHYKMTEEEEKSYENLWEEYTKLKEDKEKAEKYRKLEETSLLRQWLADKMIPKTIYLAEKCVDLGHKVIIFCAFDNEINKFREHFGELCVYHNGKLNEKKKNEAVETFQNNENVKIFIGNIISASVGLTLTAADVVIFNNFSFVPSDNRQAEDRIHRLNQTKPCTIYYQSFDGTYYDKMLDIINKKEEIINRIIIPETEK